MDMEHQKQEVVGLEVVGVKSKTECVNPPAEKYSSYSCVDWKGRPADPAKYGRFRAAIFVLGLQGFEIMAIAAVGNNLITYVFNDMHYTLAKSANIVTNFVGTTFLLSVVGGFVSDSYLGSFWSIIIFGCIELIGYIVITVQAHVPWLKPSYCNVVLSEGLNCEEPKSSQALVLFLGLYLIALGSGCVKPNILSHGGDQFDGRDAKERRQMSTYFNFAYLSFSIGELIALTLIVWIQNHCGRDVGFGVSAAVMLLALLTVSAGLPYYRNRLPQGSPLTRIAQVVVAALKKRKLKHPSAPEMLYEIRDNARQLLLHTNRFRFLDKAAIIVPGEYIEKESSWKLCPVSQIEQLKLIMRIMPIFACTIITNCILAQLQTFSVQQGSSMDTRMTKSFSIPPASLQAIPYITMVFLVPLYERVFVPFARRITGNETGISQLQRIGFGLFLSTLSMVIAALVEAKRKAHRSPPISIFWITPQFLVYGISEMLTAVGLIEFFYSQSPEGMQSMVTALTYCSFSLGFFFSSVLVSITNKITTTASHGGWLSNNDLNKDHLDLFYWLLSAISLFNLINYIFWAKWYDYNRPTLPPPASKTNVNNIHQGVDKV
ncbi:hypothetical protein SUGI_0622450 [Cryptomeria japonica]|uniref:protein NRT1/ PTR FAMILY 4.3 n=1 Tax=Cryptomeria japonica TaxID=3369 RepID=UPI0024148671|nr:protein NRT1/ PTR FAMILY 4.3 [Cryptomeria japonica]GLJ31096.1 hypothetical protein SUGI_0622450 [Cryptomeria japonica]